MGITDGNVVGEVDCSVGTIVWVRRRNGSWWPGRILGPDELSASHLMSPRSGTPVKLLGREDASVDWYNLEKSKRVKAFRCGEFDDCIEKAERSQGAAIKKREKYARREDAILHALELEREQLEKKHQKLGIKVPPVLKRALGAPSGRVGHDHCKLAKPKSQSLSKGLDSSLEEESMENPLYALKAKHGKQSSWEEDNSEAIPRMRGLQDFGLRTASSKRKLSASVASEESRKPFSDDNAPGLPCGTQIMEGVNHVHNSRLPLAVGRKAQGGLIDESHIKKRDKRRPLVQVLQSAKFPVSNSGQSDGDVSLCVQDGKEQTGVICRAKRSQCVYLPADSNDSVDHTEFSSDQMQISPSQFGIDDYQPTSGSSTEDSTSSETLDEAESDSSERDYSDHETDEEMTVLSDSTQATTVAEPINSLRYVTNGHVQEQTESMSSEELDDLAVNGYMSRPHPHDRMSSGGADVGVSKWQLKGKRNTRNLMKRSVTIGGKCSNGFIHGTYLEGKRTSLKRKSFGQRRYHGNDALNYDYDDEFIEKNPGQTQMAGFGNRRYSTLKGALGRINTDIIDSEEDPIWENEGLPQAPFRGYWDESAEYDPMYVGHRRGNGKKSVLVDVDLKARATYQGEHVPLVSLMSRLNGKAIIGHPIQIETLADGSSDALLSTNDDFIAEPMGNDGSTALTPVWRTARRTVMHRVPRPHPSAALNDDESGDPAQYSDYESKLPYQKSHVGHPNKARKITRLPEKKYSKKPIKKVSLSSQKTRMLSSIAIDQKPGGKACIQKFVNENSSLNDLIKPDNGPTTVTCIPVKLVFSRLLEAVGRPPSRPMIQSVSINGSSERKPS